jgi:transposase
MDIFEKYNIQIEDWPPYSPDLNPMEHVWVELKHWLNRKYTEIGKKKGDLDKVKARLVELLPEIWEEILEAHCEKLSTGMPDQVAAVI